jgi:DNA-binding IclR family transcriptional regulator
MPLACTRVRTSARALHANNPGMDNDRGTVERTLRLLSFIASVEGEISVKAVGEELKLPQSTAHRLVQQLVALGFLQRAGDSRRYDFGPAMYRLGALISSRVDIVRIAMPALERIVAKTNEGCALGLLREHDHTVLFAAHVESPLPLRYRISLHEPVSILWGASGRAMLAFLPPELAEQLGRSAARSPTGKAPLSMRELKKEMETIRANGFAVNRRGEKIAGASGVSAPVFGLGGRVLGCLSLTIPQVRYPEGKEAALGKLLMAESESITRALYGGG